MRIIKSTNPGAVLNKLLYTRFEDEEMFEDSRRTNERLSKYIDSDLLRNINFIADDFYGNDVYDEAEELLEEMEDVKIKEERVGRLTVMKERPNRKTRDVMMSIPNIYELYKSNKISGFRGEEFTVDQDTYEDVYNGYGDDVIDCVVYGGLEPKYKLTKSEKLIVIENVEDIIKQQRLNLDLTNR